MKFGFVATRLSGTDGVSLESEKWSRVLREMGHETAFLAGEVGGFARDGTTEPLMHFTHPEIYEISTRAFTTRSDHDSDLEAEIEQHAADLRTTLRGFIRSQKIDALIVQNANAIPMNFPLAAALRDVIEATGIPTIAHHHDFYWERDRFKHCRVELLLDEIFPADLPSIEHVTINSLAQQSLAERRGISSMVIPNVYDFATPPPEPDRYSADLRAQFGLDPGALFVLQPTRVIPRKGIEHAIELVSRLSHPDPHLVISHDAGDEGLAYWVWLTREAARRSVHMLHIADQVGDSRGLVDGTRRYQLWDVYPHADLVTFPSLYEGFGNALLEAVYFRKPVVVNRYPVYVADLADAGFDFVEMDGVVTDEVVQEVETRLADPERLARAAEQNFRVAVENYSLQTLERLLSDLISRL